jgi:hypothetical protein
MPKTPREQLEGAPRTFQVGSLEEAITLAQQFREEGKYDWFRGQVAPFMPHSSLYRRFIKTDQSEYHESRRAVGWLIQWARGIPELSHHLEGEQPYGIIAIAQHYQIPTNLIDFSTSPRIAGYFASDSKEPPKDGISCIFCLNTTILESVWTRVKAARDKLALLETVRIDVENLWRLQGQFGVFLHANYAWEIDYPMDRILFPYSGPLTESQRSDIYPKGSPLEQLLDQQFSRVPILAAIDSVQEYIRRYSPGSTFTIVPTCESDVDPSIFRNSERPPPLPSWDPEALSDWHKAVVEDYHETVGNRCLIDVSDTSDLESSLDLAIKQFAAILDAEPELRTKDVVWEVRGIADANSREAFETGLRRMWNGMRRLPYTNEEMAESARSIAALVAVGFHVPGPHSDAKAKAFAICFGDTFLAGLACDDGSNAFGYASYSALCSGVRRDLSEVLSVMPGDLDLLLKLVNDPRIIFDFAFVRERFVREIIPSQIVHGNPYTVFNPAKLTMLGHP